MKWALETATSVVSGAKDKLKGAMEDISGFFTGAGETIGKAWDLIVRGIARSVNAIGELLKQVPALVPGGKAANALGNSLVEWATPRMATGGLLRGPGTGTSDSILAAVSSTPNQPREPCRYWKPSTLDGCRPPRTCTA